MNRGHTWAMQWECVLAVMAVSLLYAGMAWATPNVPVPPRTQTAQVAKKIIYNGLDMHAQVFQSDLSQKDVIDFYKHQWGKQVSVNALQSSKIVGHLDGDSFITVQVTPDGAGSKGTIGIVKLPPKDAPRPQLGKGLPQPFGAKVVNDISYPEDHTPARTVLMVDQLAPDQNSSWFRSRLIANGWKDANTNTCSHSAPACVMQFERGKSKMMFVSEKAGGRSEVLVNIQNPGSE
ncbi:MAG TPA: hypothetical protein VF284_10205 [Rhodanobacteraceae bacterium]